MPIGIWNTRVKTGQLAGEGPRSPDPHLLIPPFVRSEPVLSSRIEGTQAALGELLAAEAGAVVDRSPEDLREVLAPRQALIGVSANQQNQTN